MLAKLRFCPCGDPDPLAALMKLEGSRQSAQPGVLMSQENNEWRGGWVSPYAANIQWDVYRNEAGQVLVKMLYNEKELAFKAGCAPLRWAASSMTSASSNAVTTTRPDALVPSLGPVIAGPVFLVQAEPACRRPACQVVPMEAAMMAVIPSHWDGGNCSPSHTSPIKAPMAGSPLVRMP
jgi:hypothetical protein